ncbi:MAG: TerC family protein [Leptospiraceae bacterium]|nr:TerC family protein [Leptospiraceae bacterium]MBK9502969.1 TerC family protein [Leptospiraceae bacterium]MBL0264631.1 TerC family protein [Leptospiraceae bacterium]MBP9162363.1 TerC family protein [Leptospiraceae bacterium]HRG44736.1 TerC family protein [Leptospiraceae bacterium]
MNLESINHELVLFILFNIIIVIMLVIDLGLLSKKTDHTMSVKRAGIWTLIWISVSFLFAGAIYFYDTNPSNLNDSGYSKTKTLEYIAGYLLEKSLSIDNLFVFIMIFQKFKIGPREQPDILKWGIIGAVILRAIMILAGATLVASFAWILYIFGFFLLYTAIKMFVHKEEEEESFIPEKHFVFRMLKKIVPLSTRSVEGKFFIIENGKRMATPLFVVLVMIESSDVMFALDSIPAVFSITQDPFIVYTSNIFAILGLRSLYFMISGIMDLFVYLKHGVAIILAFVGFKMLLPLYGELMNVEKIHIDIQVSLAVIITLLFGSILISLPEYYKNKKAGVSK